MRPPHLYALAAALLAGVSCGGGEAPAPWFEAEPEPVEGTMHFTADPLLGHAIAVADIDLDMRPELFVGRGRTDAILLRCPSRGACVDLTEAAGLADVEASAAAFLHADGDDFLDLFVASPGSLRLFVGDGGGAFSEVTGVGLEGLAPVQPAHLLPVDIDDDGRLDLYVSDYGGPNMLLRARPGGGYEEAAVEHGVAGSDRSLVASLFDADGDGAADLFVGTDALVDDFGELPEYSESRRFITSDRLYRRVVSLGAEAPILEDVTVAAHLDVPRSTMGALVVDVDGDASFDLFLSDVGRNHLVRGPASPAFDFVTAALGLAGALHEEGTCPDAAREDDCLRVSWGATFRDFDGDGEGDLFVANGGLDIERAPLQPVGAFTGSVAGLFVAADAGLDTLNARAVVDVDLDGDGDVDLLVSQYGAPLLRVAGVRRAFGGLHVTLRGGSSNADGAGAIVRAELDDGSSRHLAAGSGGVLQVSRQGVTFDVDPPRVVALRVSWPSGLETSTVGPFGREVELAEPTLLRMSSQTLSASAAETITLTLSPPATGIEASAGTLGPLMPFGDAGQVTTFTPPGELGRVSFALLVDGVRLRARPSVLVTP